MSFSLLLLLVGIFGVLETLARPEGAKPCGYYLTPSLIPGAGRGIVAGRDYNEDEPVESAGPALLVDNTYCPLWSLHNYVYSSASENYSMAVFGVAMLINHSPNPQVSHYWTNDGVVSEPEDQTEAHATYTPVAIHVKPGHSLKAGEEMLTSYGGENWFTDRGIMLNQPGEEGNTTYGGTEIQKVGSRTYDLDELDQVGHCLSDIYVDESTTPLAGKGVFANRDFKKGEIVSISPILLMPRKSVTDESSHSNSVLINYLYTTNYSNVGILALGTGVVINHPPKKGADNVAIEWYYWPEKKGDVSKKEHTRLTHESPVEKLISSEFSPLDIAYRATKDIAEGEEIFMDYGDEWFDAWHAHVMASNVYMRYMLQDPDSTQEFPLFRTPIGLPPGIIPESWQINDADYEEYYNTEGEAEGEGENAASVEAGLDGSAAPELTDAPTEA